MNENFIPATPDVYSDSESQSNSQDIPEQEYMKYAVGYDSDGFPESQDEDIEDDDSSAIGGEVAPESEDSSDEQSSYIVDGVDLGFVPENLRRANVVDTLKAIEDSRKHAEAAMTRASSEASDLRKLIQDKGHRDPYSMQMADRVQNLQNNYSVKLNQAKDYYLRQIDSGEMSEAEANFEYGKYATGLKGQLDTDIQREYINVNTNIIEKFVNDYTPILSNPAINKAAEVMLRDVISDGMLIDEQRTNTYLELGKQIYEEAYKAGLAASQGSKKTNAQNNKAKQRMSATQVQRKATASSAKGGSIPWSTPDDVPQEVWNTRADVRKHFGIR